MTTHECIKLQQALTVLTEYCHKQSRDAGWWTDLSTGQPLVRNKGEMLMLIVTEVAEAMEGVRKNLQDDHLPEHKMETVEIADTLVRLFDYIGGHGLEIATAFTDKLEYNCVRQDHSVEHRQSANGKKC